MAFTRRVLAAAVLGTATMMSSSLLSGCGSFFSCEGKTSCGTSTTTPGGTGTDFLYVSNSPSGNTYLSAYTITSGTLTANLATGADLNLGYVPVAMVIDPTDKFLYVASRADAPPVPTGAGVYVYAISSTGTLTVANGGKPVSNDQGISSMDISPDGGYLFTVSTSTNAGVILTEYVIDKTTGLPTVGTTTISTLGTTCAIATGATPLSQQCTVKVSPSENFVAVALGSYGFEVFPYTSAAGVTNTPQLAPSTTVSAFSLAFDKNNDLYVSGTSSVDGTSYLTPYTGIGGTGTPVAGTSISYAAGITPRSVTVTTNSDFVYTANEGDSTISPASLSGTGVVTAVGAPILGPTNVSAVGVDSTDTYLIAAGFSSVNGLQLFSIGTTGALSDTGVTFASGTDATVPVLLAVSH